MKTIKRLSEELGISKEAIYKKLKFQLKEQLEGHTTKIDNVTHIDDEGERLIRQSLGHERHETLQGIIEAGETDNQPHITEYIRLLEEQVRTKDTQLEAQNGHIGLLIQQLGNNRLLSQAEYIKGLLTTVQVNTAATTSLESQKIKRKSAWRRIFNRKD